MAAKLLGGKGVTRASYRRKCYECAICLGFVMIVAWLFTSTPTPDGNTRAIFEAPILRRSQHPLEEHPLEASPSSTAAVKLSTPVPGGCHTLHTEEKCVHAVDGRADQRFGGQPCVWCCGESCYEPGVGEDMNKCEPMDYITAHDAFTGRGRSISLKTRTRDAFFGIDETITTKMDTCSTAKKVAPVDLNGLTEDSTSTIFVAIAAFRDNLCHETLRSLFGQAKHPDRVYVGLVQQNAPEDRDCVEEYCEKVGAGACRADQVSVKHVKHVDSKGVNWARYLTQEMLKDEKFWFQMDAHTHFKKHWDTTIIMDWERTGDPWAILTTYPLSLSHEHDKSEYKYVPRTCGYYWNGAMPFNQQAIDSPPGPVPKGTLFWAAGMSFSNADTERIAPYDPHTEYLFSGEEILRAARYFTHGFNLYTPTVNTIFHYYYRPGAPRNNANTQAQVAMEDRSRNRILHLLGATPRGEVEMKEIDKYGMGCKREVKRFLELADVDLNRHILKDKKFFNEKRECKKGWPVQPILKAATQPAGACHSGMTEMTPIY